MPPSSTPGFLCQSERPVIIDEGTSCRAPSPIPGITSQSRSDIASWSMSAKLLNAAYRAGPKLPADMRGEFMALFSPTAIAVTVATLTTWAALHFVGIGEIADAIFLVVGVFTIGMQAFTAAKDIATFIQVARSATTDRDLDTAATALAKAVAIIGVTTFVAVIFKAGKGAGKEAKLTGQFWEAYDFEADYAGTSVSTRFTIKVDGREFRIKPNATDHMAEYSKAQFNGPATINSQTDFPISPLAAAWSK